jgi:hypothetical protein
MGVRNEFNPTQVSARQSKNRRERADYTHDGWVFGRTERVELVAKQGVTRKAQ